MRALCPFALSQVLLLDLHSRNAGRGGHSLGDAMDLMESHYNKGLASEADQLPCFRRTECEDKEHVQAFLDMENEYVGEMQDVGKRKMKQTPQEEKNEASVLERKKYLNSPTRKGLILQHRENLANVRRERKGRKLQGSKAPPKLAQTLPERASHLTPIHLQEMHPTQDHIYALRIIDLTVIDEPILNFYPSVHLIVEDENGDVRSLYVYKVQHDEHARKNLGFGCKLHGNHESLHATLRRCNQLIYE